MVTKVSLTTGLTLILCGLPPAATTARGTAPSAADQAATSAYLTASSTYEQAVFADRAASEASLNQMTGAIGSQCPGILTNVPASLDPFALGKAGSPGVPSARARGESRRRERQITQLGDELSEAARRAFSAPTLAAAEAFAATVAMLSWSDPRITQLAHQTTSEQVQRLRLPPPDLCADIQAWVASGYRTLAPATKQLLLVSHSGSSEFAILKLIALLHLDKGTAKKLFFSHLALTVDTFKRLSESIEALSRKLGFPTNSSDETEETEKRKPIKVAHGKTAAGERYTVYIELPEARHGFSQGCSVGIEEKSEVKIEGVSIPFSVIGGPECPGSGRKPRARVACDRGRLVVNADTLPATRRVVLHLSDGRTIDSRPIRIPKRLNPGRGGVYYQVVRGPLPIPVSLTELDAHRHMLRTVKLNHVTECTKNLVHYLPGGQRVLVHDTIPQGPTFTITARHYRSLGHTYFNLRAEVKTSAYEEGTDYLGAILLGYTHSGGKARELFSMQRENQCQPHPYALIYGLLKPPGASVLVRIAGALKELRSVPLPASLHTSGKLVYAALPTLPEELITRSAQGKTLATEKLGQAGKELIETCEGEAEG